MFVLLSLFCSGRVESSGLLPLVGAAERVKSGEKCCANSKKGAQSCDSVPV